MLAYAHAQGAEPIVSAHARVALEGKISGYNRSRAIASTAIASGALITVVPNIPSCSALPASTTFACWHSIEFVLSVGEQLTDGQLIAGTIDFYVGPVLIGSVNVEMRKADRGEIEPIEPRHNTAAAYEQVFVSYSHKDADIVDGLQKACEVLGMRYLRDVRDLRSGQQWNAALLKLIEGADVFQLCWSHAAKASKYVEQEWRHACVQQRPTFIRPVYWDRPMPDCPAELRDIHFAYLELPRRTWWNRVPRIFRRV
jgi:hypothetical protein